jgi:hypothetical protein
VEEAHQDKQSGSQQTPGHVGRISQHDAGVIIHQSPKESTNRYKDVNNQYQD